MGGFRTMGSLPAKRRAMPAKFGNPPRPRAPAGELPRNTRNTGKDTAAKPGGQTPQAFGYGLGPAGFALRGTSCCASMGPCG